MASKILAPVRKIGLIEQVLERLRNHILKKEFPPGAEFPSEGALVELLGVSRTVVREAMRTLRSEGLIEVAQGRRPRVKPPDSQFAVDTMVGLLRRREGTLLNLIEVRIPLEQAIAALAAERATPEHIDAMEAAIEGQSAAAALPEQIACDLQFHSLLAISSGNPIFELFLATVAELLRESFATTLERTGTQRAIEGHRRVLDAIRRRDPEQARGEMQLHLEWARIDLSRSAT